MTLGEGKERVYMLLDEHSSGGRIEHDADLEAKMLAFFDIAQKLLAQVRKIRRTRTIYVEPGRSEYRMGTDFYSPARIWRDGRIAANRYHWRRGRLIVPEGDGAKELTVEYFARPETIPADAGDDYVFELDEEGCALMPYYVAAQQLSADLVMDYSVMLGLFHEGLAMLRADEAPGPGRVVQSLYR